MALVTNTLEKDPAPSSGLDFLQGIAQAGVRDRQTAQCDSTFPENRLDKTLKQGHNELCQLRFSVVYKATCKTINSEPVNLITAAKGQGISGVRQKQLSSFNLV